MRQDLLKALTDIKAVKSQIARGTEFRGYGPLALAVTGGFAVAAALFQMQWIEYPTNNMIGYLALWIVTALLSTILIGVDVVTRSRRVHSGLADEMVQSATEQLLPSMVTGGLLTLILLRFAPLALWMLPGLWQIVLSLGIFASCRSLPAPFFMVGLWYLSTGLACLAFAGNENAFSPWAMGIPFGIGQFLAAALIYRMGLQDAQL